MKILLALVFMGAACVAQADSAALQAAIDADHRGAQAVARDKYRHPRQTLEFFAIAPDMTVVELWPGGGWYTDILAPYLRERGTLYAAHFNPAAEWAYFRKSRAQFERRIAAAPELYRAVKITSFDPPALVDIAPPASADRVLTFRNVHNWYMRGGGPERLLAAFQAMHRALKPGGLLGLVDHRLPADRPLSDQDQSGYMREDYVIEMAERAGFELIGRSEVNANPADTADHPKGVWTLPPSLRGPEDQLAHYLTIGESDRMTLKFIKP